MKKSTSKTLKRLAAWSIAAIAVYAVVVMAIIGWGRTLSLAWSLAMADPTDRDKARDGIDSTISRLDALRGTGQRPGQARG